MPLSHPPNSRLQVRHSIRQFSVIWLCIGCELEGYATLPDPALDPEPYLRLLKCLVMYKLELSPREVKMSKLEKAHQDVFIRN